MMSGSDTDAEALARSTLVLTDVREAAAAGESPAEYLTRKFDVDAAKYHSESALQDAVRTARDEDDQ